MPPVRFHRYDYNLSTNENFKLNMMSTRMAQNRWGAKFKKYWKRHDEPAAAQIDGQDVMGTYDFTEGMRVAVESIEDQQESLQKAKDFRQALIDNLEVKDSGGNWSLESSLRHSYMAVLIKGGAAADGALLGLKLSLSLDEPDDDRAVSWWHSSGESDGTVSQLLPLDPPGSSSVLELHSDDGNAYGHEHGGLRDGTTQDNALSRYGVEDHSNSRFHDDQDTRFGAFWADLEYYAPKIVRPLTPDTEGERASVIVGLDQLFAWLDAKISKIEEGITKSEDNQGRAKEDLELMEHIGVKDSIAGAVPDADDVEKIWFRFQKTIEPPADADETYKWWEEPQFNNEMVEHPETHKMEKLYRIGDYWKDFYEACVVDWENKIVYLRKDAFDVNAGWKVYWLVQTFLGTDFETTWWYKIKKLIMFAVGAVLTWLSDNPTFIKMVLIAYQALDALGAVTPEMSMAFSVVMMLYNLGSANFSAMSGLDQFQFAIGNVEQVSQIVAIAQTIGMQEQAKAEAEKKAKQKALVAQMGEATEFIYTRAYSQYDEMYNALYRYDLPSLTPPLA